MSFDGVSKREEMTSDDDDKVFGIVVDAFGSA